MGRAETSFLHPDLRVMQPPEFDAASVVPELAAMLGSWVRIVLVDQRVFVGTLRAIDDSRNLVLANAVEVRPVKREDGSRGEERKGHRGFAMIRSKEIVSVGRRKQKKEEEKKKE